ncbi:General L-amino acid transport system ATP-binding protein OS=Castellaniella defragrans OX=75697 GN=HNR28_002710 PE=3 SV=1 [Castellaniella defragrans]
MARAMAMRPQAILFDKPGFRAQTEMVNEVLKVMTELAADGMTMIVVTRQMGFARRVSDRIIFMDAGTIEEGEPGSFFDHPKNERTQAFLSKILTH